MHISFGDATVNRYFEYLSGLVFSKMHQCPSKVTGVLDAFNKWKRLSGT